METNEGKSVETIALIYKEREIISKEAGNKKKGTKSAPSTLIATHIQHKLNNRGWIQSPCALIGSSNYLHDIS